MEELQFITLGSDCSPASVLLSLKLRKFALPFDWVGIGTQQLCSVISNMFQGYHDNLTISETCITDGYGVNFPHDYPTIEKKVINDEDEWIPEKTIVSDWESHCSTVREKYSRRIERFNTILQSKHPLIALFRGHVHDAIEIRNILEIIYNKFNIVFIVATNETSSDPLLITCDPEKNGSWNDATIWNEAIQKGIEILKSTYLKV